MAGANIGLANPRRDGPLGRPRRASGRPTFGI